MNKKHFTIQISEEGINVLLTALESYSRLGLRQFRYALECLEDFDKLDYDVQLSIEKHLQLFIPGDNNLGIYNKKAEKFNKAFQIKKELEKYLHLSKSDGIKTAYSNIYDGSLQDYPYLPRFIDENGKRIEHKKEFDIPVQIQGKLKKLIEKKKFDEVWEMIYKNIDFKGIKGPRTKISDDLKKVIVSEPYLLKT